MPVYKDSDGRWRYRIVVKKFDGAKVRISGTPTRNTKLDAQDAERAHIERTLRPPPVAKPRAMTFREWFNGDFWQQWVVGKKNKASEQESKRSIYDFHLDAAFGRTPIDEIDTESVAKFRALLVGKKLSEKRINNILTVLSKALHYAHRVRKVDIVPEIGFFKVERPEVEFLEFDDYARLVEAAQADREPEWLVAILLGGDGGLRVGEIKALQWNDVDLVAGTITVRRQVRYGHFGTPKGRTRRDVPMTPTLIAALRAMPEPHDGYVVRNSDGTWKRDQNARSAILRISKRAERQVNGWHILRHTFATHAAMFHANPWTLMTWMGHKTMEETLRYVDVSKSHKRPVPQHVLEAAEAETDPDRRVLAMLAARGKTAPKKEVEPVKND